MKWQPYPEYKDSGVEWLGAVPAHWEVVRVKALEGNNSSVVQTGPFGAQLHASDYVDEGVPLVLIRNVDNLRIDDTDIPRVTHEDAERLSMYRLDVGDIVFSRVGSIGRIAPCTEREKGWLISGQMLRLRIRNPKLDSRFSTYAFSSDAELAFVSLQSVGSTRESINTDILRNMPLPIPSPDEQRAITAFLDRETGRIDALITKKERQIELLQEKRAVLISHAVTKGLDPDAPMKDSGIAWLGEIPAHWEVMKLSLASTSLQTGPFGSQLHASDYVDDGIPVINPSNLQDGKIVPDWRCTIDEETFERLKRHRLVRGDIVFARRGEMGRCAQVTDESEGFLCGTGSLRVRLNPRFVTATYLALLLSIPGIRDHLLLESVGSTMDNLNTDILSKVPVLVPPEEEQSKITEYLALITAQTNTIVSAVTRSMEMLQEYRTALISATVTGKIDVRDEQPSETAMEAAWLE